MSEHISSNPDDITAAEVMENIGGQMDERPEYAGGARMGHHPQGVTLSGDEWTVLKADFDARHAPETDAGADRIARERRRQIVGEGWSAERDDAYTKGELAQAAYCYALPTEIRRIGDMDFPSDLWPEGWDRSWWKPGDGSIAGRIRELEKAGALLAAEIDRLQRAELKANDV